MDLLRTGVKDLLIPGSLLFLILGVLVGVPLLFGHARAARWGRRWLAGLLALYFVLSLQGTSDLLVLGLSRSYRSLRTAEEARGAAVVVVLSNGAARIELSHGGLDIMNGQSAYNVLEAAHVYRLLGNPMVVVSGGRSSRTGSEARALAVALKELGIPDNRLVLEDRSFSTRQQGHNVSDWLKAHGRPMFVLVTAPEHMRRALGVFTAQGLQPIPSLSAIRYGGRPFWKPTMYALGGSRDAIYEYFAIAFYLWKGWM